VQPTDTAGEGLEPGRFWRSPDGRVAALSVGVAACTVVVQVFLLIKEGLPSLHGAVVPVWVLVLMFAATEGFAIHVRVRRGGHAMGLSEIPMVLGLLGSAPLVLLGARLLGGTAGLFALRRQRGLKLGFNVALIGVQASVPTLVYHSLVGHTHALGPREWGVTLAAMFVSDILAGVLVTAAIALHDDPSEWKRLPRVLRGLPLVAATTTISLIGAMAVGHDTRALLLLAVIGLVTYLAYRGYVRQSQGHAQVEELYTFTRALDGSRDTAEVARIVLSQIRDQLRAETAELVVPGTGGHGYLRTRLAGHDELTSEWLPELPADAWWGDATGGEPVNLPLDRDRDPVDGIAVPVPMGDGIGVLLVTDSLPDTPEFTGEHVKLFQALANHASVAIAKSLLVDRLRHEVSEKERLALQDPLTGLPNRRRFNQLVEDAVAGGRAAVIILMDLDRFKEVNDALGHDTGDALLRVLGPRLQRRLGPRGMVARLGGDEFAALLPDIGNAADAVAIAEELTGEVERPIPVGALQLNTRASIGIALAPEHGTDAKTLLQRADVAMYSAKDTRSGGRVYQPEHDRNTPHRLAMIGELDQAINRRDLLVVFQPKLDPVSGLITGAEALARWHHPEQGYIPPDQFIPLAEHSGLIRPLTLHVLEVALRRCAGWRRAGHDLHVAVNLSPNSLLDVNLPDVVARLLGQSGIPAGSLTLEITETSIMADPTGSVRTLEQLNALGVKLAIDDFGTGYSSLGRLRELPIHEVKIDKSFVQRIAVDHRDRAVVRSAVQLGHALDLEVVAEGVEDSETYAHLTREGCNVVQGYYVSRPLPADEFITWLRERPAKIVLPGTPVAGPGPGPGNVVYPRFGS
jgi:diguanylate cyclase (GGDEF)-like protein